MARVVLRSPLQVRRVRVPPTTRPAGVIAGVKVHQDYRRNDKIVKKKQEQTTRLDLASCI